VVGRILFRIVFNIEDGEPAAFQIPRLSVSLGFGPDVKLFGSVSWQALQTSALDGVRLAFVILFFASITTFFDLKALLYRAPKWMQSVALPIGSALTFVPVLSTNISRIRDSSKLRKNSKRSILTPVLESTIERAVELAQSMQIRGVGRLKHGSDFPALNNFSLDLAGQRVLNSVSIQTAPGKVVLVTGATGSGKTLLLKSLAGLAPAFTGGKAQGQYSPGSAGYLSQQPELSFVCDRVRDEIGFAMLQLGWSRAKLTEECERLASLLDLSDLLDAEVSALSAGQQQRVALAATLATGRKTVLLDEPSSALDDSGQQELLSAIAKLKQRGCAVIVAEHHLQRFVALADEVIEVSKGEVRTLTREELLDLTSRELKPVSKSESVTVLLGPNGSGKTTRLRQLAQDPFTALVPQFASDILLATSVRAELPNSRAVEVFQTLVGEVNLESHPHDLSAGSQLALAIAIQVSENPMTLLLDEPTRGLDHAAKQKLLELISEFVRQDKQVVVATNDREFATALNGKVIQLTGFGGAV
jgi:energy-coupling factor transport system ATP-binding protein